jgi:hypothetical protein
MMQFTQIPQRDKARDLMASDLRQSSITTVYEIAARSTPAIHALGRVPSGFTVVSAMNTAGTAAINVSATQEDRNKWTADRIYTRADAAGTSKIKLD